MLTSPTLAFVQPLLLKWDLTTFLKSATEQIKSWGGLALGILGVIILIWAGVSIFKKFTSNPQQQQGHGWGMIVVMILVGGAMTFGGLNLFINIGEGGQQTISDLGGDDGLGESRGGDSGAITQPK